MTTSSDHSAAADISVLKTAICASGSMATAAIALAKEVPGWTWIAPIPLLYYNIKKHGPDGKTHEQYADEIYAELKSRCLGHLPSPQFKEMTNPPWLDLYLGKSK